MERIRPRYFMADPPMHRHTYLLGRDGAKPTEVSEGDPTPGIHHIAIPDLSLGLRHWLPRTTTVAYGSTSDGTELAA